MPTDRPDQDKMFTGIPYPVEFRVTPVGHGQFEWSATLKINTIPGGGKTLTGYGKDAAAASRDLALSIDVWGVDDK